MIYTPTNVKQETSKRGTTYWRADLTDMNGQLFEGVAFFTAVKENVSIDGFLESEMYNGKQSYKFKLTAQVSQGGKSAGIVQAQERKETGIATAQDRKEEGIALAGSITNATNIIVAMLNRDLFELMDESGVKSKLREYIIFYQNLYRHPEDINPSSHDL